MIENGSRRTGADGEETTYDAKTTGVRPSTTRGGPQTLSVRHTRLTDVPVMMDDRALNDGLATALVAAIDGVRTIAELAHVIGVDPEQARACFAFLGNDGIVAFERETPSLPPRSRPGYWLEDLHPRKK